MDFNNNNDRAREGEREAEPVVRRESPRPPKWKTPLEHAKEARSNIAWIFEQAKKGNSGSAQK